MTILLKDGDYRLDSRGRILEAGGRMEQIQQALIRLQARKGGFSLDSQLGSELFRLDLNHAELADLEPLVREALAPIRGLQIVGLDRSIDHGDGRLLLTVHLLLDGEEAEIELGGAAEG